MGQELPKIAIEIVSRLENELSKDYYYHSAQHTVEVINECLLFAKSDSLIPKQIELLAISAAFHDAGFLKQYSENEEIGAALAEKAMLEDGSYTKEDISEVKKCILSTRVLTGFSRNAYTRLSKYLLDADLASLGRDDVLEKTELLAKEQNIEFKTFLNQTLALMEVHEWLTPAAKHLRQEGKDKNIKRIKELLKA